MTALCRRALLHAMALLALVPAAASAAGTWTARGNLQVPRASPTLTELPDPDLELIAADAEVELSWQNSVASIRRAPEPHVVLADEGGAAVVFPGSADLALLVVRRDARRRRHGTRLIQAAAARCGRPMRILNVDARAAGIAAFAQSVGAKPLVRQLEMAREI